VRQIGLVLRGDDSKKKRVEVENKN